MGIGFVGGQPPFITGQSISAKLVINNPTIESLTYVISLWLGTNLIGSFPAINVLPGASVETGILTGVAPSIAGVYDVLISVIADGAELPQMAAGTVKVNEPEPDIEVISLTWL